MSATIFENEDHSGQLIQNVGDPVDTQDAATKNYVDSIAVTFNAVIFKGVIDCSGNPDYPAADRGWLYVISVAGKIGGASGLDVLPRDIIICLDDGTPSGDQATVGVHWTVVHADVDATVISSSSTTTDLDFVQWDGTTGLIVKDNGLSLDTDGTLAADSDSHIPSQKAVKTYVDTSATGGDVVGPGSSTNSDFAQFNGTTGKIIKDGGLALDTDGTLAADSDVKVPSQKAVKTYVDGSTPAGAALTKVDDTNVTLALGGTPTTALLRAVSLTLGWTGQLAAARGGTGVSSLGDITKTDDTNVTLTLGGTPTGSVIHGVSLTLGWSGTLAVARGGTGAATAGAHKFFGNNTGSTAAPGFEDIKEADLVLTDNTTNDASTSQHGFLKKLNGDVTTFLNGNGAFTAPTSSGRTFTTLTDSNTITPNSSYGGNIEINTQSGSTLTVNAPSGSPSAMQGLLLRIKSTNAKTFSWDTAFRAPSLLPMPTSLSAGKTIYVGFVYNDADSKWDLSAVLGEY